MLKSASKLVIGIFLSVVMLSVGHGQELAPLAAFSKYKSLLPAKNFTPVNLSVPSGGLFVPSNAKNKKNNNPQVAYWGATTT
jgi:hypothetical protein